LSQSAASVPATVIVAFAADAAIATLASKRSNDTGSAVFIRSRAAAEITGGLNSCGSYASVTCLRTSAGCTRWLKRRAMTIGSPTRLF
jgi:hypothetical protein